MKIKVYYIPELDRNFMLSNNRLKMISGKEAIKYPVFRLPKSELHLLSYILKCRRDGVKKGSYRWWVCYYLLDGASLDDAKALAEDKVLDAHYDTHLVYLWDE